MDRIKAFLVTGFGAGYLPVAPGTWGSAAAAGAYLLVAWAARGRHGAVDAALAAILVASSVICVALGPFAEARFGKKDPGQVSIDEWAGQAVALLGLPLIGPHGRLIAAGVGFVAFRVFDIVKPPPARAMEKAPAGWGVLLDDLIAGVYANIAAQIILRLLS